MLTKANRCAIMMLTMEIRHISNVMYGGVTNAES